VPRRLHNDRVNDLASLHDCIRIPLLETPKTHTYHKSNIMRITSFASALALFLGAVTALDKPLDIQVTKAVECSRKAQKG
jgi:hypothetical protein